jgi:uncharacterized membrane protein
MDQSHSRQHIYAVNTFGQRAADAIANSMGSWTFIIAQSVVIAFWVVLNVVGSIDNWDPYPFILLNLLFSTQAAYAAPVIMMSQSRQAQKDHLRDDQEAAEVDLLFQINRQQLEILQLLRTSVVPDAPPETAAEVTLKHRAAQLEAQALEIEDETAQRHISQMQALALARDAAVTCSRCGSASVLHR